jgi:transposase-like protein
LWHLPLKDEDKQLTVVEGARDVSAANAQAPVASVNKTRSRRPRLSLEEKREIARLYADTSTSTSEICARLGIGESSLYRIIQLQGIPPRGRTGSSASVGTTQPSPVPSRIRYRSSDDGRHPGLKAANSAGAAKARAIESDVQLTPEPAVAPIARGAKSVTRRRRPALAGPRTRVSSPIETPAANAASAVTRTRRGRTAGVSRSSDLHQFTVSFVVERTLQAASVLDAIQQAHVRGATEVTSIVRIA